MNHERMDYLEFSKIENLHAMIDAVKSMKRKATEKKYLQYQIHVHFKMFKEIGVKPELYFIANVANSCMHEIFTKFTNFIVNIKLHIFTFLVLKENISIIFPMNFCRIFASMLEDCNLKIYFKTH